MTAPVASRRVLLLVSPDEGSSADRRMWHGTVGAFERLTRRRGDVDVEIIRAHADELVASLREARPDGRTLVALDYHGGYWSGQDHYAFGSADGARIGEPGSLRKPFLAAAIISGACRSATVPGRDYLGTMFGPDVPLIASTSDALGPHASIMALAAEELLDGRTARAALSRAKATWSRDGRLGSDTLESARRWRATSTR